ncbi:EAL domain-containing protein [Zoogloea sp.]|jgi:diguanylate cyclase (GGDEF)-like protein|uniref:putative bifunctional diguanylate cyclase/phosphodiesterase n=1 Tax=Zoogloea sp. TaxID=49181 RepID=UPI0011D4C70C|nr:EAL domain-containing protein [Zoogloea sp.]MBK6652532.1 EAL domain-containing protein [Zoogloea sp.]MBK7848578.1 EAL domain-containing protein [Zoogloea sp.]MBP7444656.1 EAL domain-containing protein [Zoogloea sp.]TXG94515.1 MAG: EAL domain-containing protein [Zoogloea sp.]HPI60302.1 EAL domain-containing protein [Zoogloea sp.]
MTATESARILVVDDDPLTRLMASEALREGGFVTLEAQDGAQALGMFDAAVPDLVLLDVMMPGLSGFEVCEQIRARPNGALVPIIMLTGLDDGDSVQRAFDVGATDFISKPINWTLLRFRIRYVLRSAQVMKELTRNKESLSNAQRIARLGSWEWLVGDDRVQRSDQYYRLFGQPASAFGAGMEAVLDHVYLPDRPLVAAALEGARRGVGFQLTYRVVWPDGSVRTVVETVEPGDSSEGAGLVMEGSAQDITDQVDAQRRIRQLAYYDHLTGLPNREFFRENLLGAAVRCLRNDSRCAVMVVDIDRFARINDSLGPERGDQVLQVIGHRLRECMGDRAPAEPAGGGALPSFKVARLAADEFGILMPDVGHLDEAVAVAHRLLGVVRAPIHVPGQDITLSARIGLAVMPDHTGDADALLKAAETALNRAKRTNGEPVALFSEEMKVAAFLRFTLEGELRRAIGDHELRVVYQPIVDAATGMIVKAEALVRWPHMGRGPVPPPEFISLAEETGMIVPLSREVFERVCADIAELEADMPPGFRISVNLSGVNFMDAQLIPTVRAELAKAGVPASRIEFELTETVLMRDLDYATGILAQLREMGVRVAVDDFGTGYSSLAYLRRLAVDTLKIDRSFVSELDDGQGIAIVEAVIGLAHSLGLEVVAEGVETISQLAALHQRGCHLIQGYLFARPMSAKMLSQALQSGIRMPPGLSLPMVGKDEGMFLGSFSSP